MINFSFRRETITQANPNYQLAFPPRIMCYFLKALVV